MRHPPSPARARFALSPCHLYKHGSARRQGAAKTRVRLLVGLPDCRDEWENHEESGPNLALGGSSISQERNHPGRCDRPSCGRAPRLPTGVVSRLRSETTGTTSDGCNTHRTFQLTHPTSILPRSIWKSSGRVFNRKPIARFLSGLVLLV
jgi:hypothetical protein